LFLTIVVFIFFQAEDGIRYFHVTGVQTCALPILKQFSFILFVAFQLLSLNAQEHIYRHPDVSQDQIVFSYANDLWLVPKKGGQRSEERRVGKEGQRGGAQPGCKRGGVAHRRGGRG